MSVSLGLLLSRAVRVVQSTDLDPHVFPALSACEAEEYVKKGYRSEGSHWLQYSCSGKRCSPVQATNAHALMLLRTHPASYLRPRLFALGAWQP